MNTTNIVKELAKINKSTFVSIKDYTTEKGETKNYLINCNSDYKTALEKSVINLFKYNPSTKEEKEAKEEIMLSLKHSLDNYKSEQITFGDKVVKCVKKNDSGKMFIMGFVFGKTKHPETVKGKLYATLPVSRFRQFEISPNKMGSIVVNGKNIKVS